MYIIGGKLKGRKLASCKTDSIRPAMALVRKSLFDIFKDFVVDSNVLDLCAGSGILGIQAVSRGARELTLIDSSKDAIKLIYKNLELCNLKAKVIYGRLPKALNKINSNNGQFDIIFLDPPYGEKSSIENVLNAIVSEELITKDGVISIESEFKNNFSFPETLKLNKEKRFGNTKITILCNT